VPFERSPTNEPPPRSTACKGDLLANGIFAGKPIRVALADGFQPSRLLSHGDASEVFRYSVIYFTAFSSLNPEKLVV
jgi:hypothetical protein